MTQGSGAAGSCSRGGREMEGTTRPLLTYLMGIVLIVFCIWVLVREVIHYLRKRKWERDPLNNLALAAICFYGMLWNFDKYPFFAGLLGGGGVFFLGVFLVDVAPPHILDKFPWWGSVVSLLVGLWVFQAYPGWYPHQSDFVQGFSGLTFLLVEGILFCLAIAVFCAPGRASPKGVETGRKKEE